MTRARFRIFFDMDGVLVDFEAFMRRWGLTGDEVKKLPGTYKAMQPIAGALDGIRKIMSIAGQYGGEVWLATKPPTGIPYAYADKVSWVLHHLPELKRRIILTHDKGLLGGPDDYLVDDRPWRANCDAFRGTLIHFGPGAFEPTPATSAEYKAVDWDGLVSQLHDHMRSRFALIHSDETKSGASLDDINAARGLLRLGPVPAATFVEAPAFETAPNVAGNQPALVTRPVHGGYPGEVRNVEGEHAIAEIAHQRVTPLPFKAVHETTPPVGRFDGGRFGWGKTHDGRDVPPPTLKTTGG